MLLLSKLESLTLKNGAFYRFHIGESKNLQTFKSKSRISQMYNSAPLYRHGVGPTASEIRIGLPGAGVSLI